MFSKIYNWFLKDDLEELDDCINELEAEREKTRLALKEIRKTLRESNESLEKLSRIYKETASTETSKK